MSGTLALPPEAAEWLANGEQGISSKAIFYRLVFGIRQGDWPTDYPSDPSDFIRCERLLRAVPGLRERLPEMAAHGPTWAGLIAKWSQLIGLIEVECPGAFNGATGRADRAYDLMTEIQEQTGRR